MNGIRNRVFSANSPPIRPKRWRGSRCSPKKSPSGFGFPPDRRVINLILKDNYSNREVEFEFEAPSRGGFFP